MYTVAKRMHVYHTGTLFKYKCVYTGTVDDVFQENSAKVKRRAQTYQRLDHIDSVYVVVSFSIHSRGCGGDIWSPTQWSSSYDLRISWRMPDEVPARPRAIPCVLHINHKLSDARCPCWISSSPACLLIFVPSVTAWQPDICSITPLPNTHTRSSTGITMHSK